MIPPRASTLLYVATRLARITRATTTLCNTLWPFAGHYPMHCWVLLEGTRISPATQLVLLQRAASAAAQHAAHDSAARDVSNARARAAAANTPPHQNSVREPTRHKQGSEMPTNMTKITNQQAAAT